MSHHIPFEMQQEIIKRLPVISLLQFRSVSKTWRSLIDSPPFIAAHTARRARSHRLLVRYVDEYHGDTYLSSLDDDTYPQQEVALIVPSSVECLADPKLFYGSHGLFCFYGFDDISEDLEKAAVVWNPSIRKSIVIDLPNEDDYVFGFGVCPVTHDVKILIANYNLNPIPNMVNVKVIILSSGAARIQTISVAGISPDTFRCHVGIDRFIYWLVSSDSYVIDGESLRFAYIWSFDLTNDEFGIVCLPINLAVAVSDLRIFKLNESLAVVKYDFNSNLKGYNVWHMIHGVPDVLFIKLFTVDFYTSEVKSLLGFKKCGESILELQDDEDKALGVAALADFETLYDTLTKYGIVGIKTSFSAYSYEETLLLLNQPDSVNLLALYED